MPQKRLSSVSTDPGESYSGDDQNGHLEKIGNGRYEHLIHYFVFSVFIVKLQKSTGPLQSSTFEKLLRAFFDIYKTP